MTQIPSKFVNRVEKFTRGQKRRGAGQCPEFSSVPERKSRVVHDSGGKNLKSQQLINIGRDHFPTKAIHTIWQNIEIPFTMANSFHLVFKLRHRRVFKGIVLHQIAKHIYSRMCCMCNDEEEDEDLEHILHCSAHIGLWEQVQRLLEQRCNVKIQTEE